jgi:hypothetical protein
MENSEARRSLGLFRSQSLSRLDFNHRVTVQSFGFSKSHASHFLQKFGIVVQVTIIVNAVCMGVAHDYPEPAFLWTVFENIFTSIYTLEMVIKLFVLKREYFRDSWNLLDFFLAWVGITDCWILIMVDSGPLGGLQVVRVLRLFRILRLQRILRLTPHLAVLMEGLAGSFKSMFWIVLLLIAFVYIMSLVCCNLIFDSDTYSSLGVPLDTDLYFGTVLRAMETLLNVALLDEWSGIVRPMFSVQPYMSFIFWGYLFLVTFGVLNLVIGVITERTMQAEEAQHVEAEKTKRKLKMKNLTVLADQVYDSYTRLGLSENDLEDAVRGHPELRDNLEALDLPKGFNVCNLHLMFDQGLTGLVEKEDFMNGMFRLIFADEFQRSCCIMLAVAETKQQIAEGLAKLRRDLGEDIRQLLRKELRPAVSEFQHKHSLHSEGCAGTGVTTISASRPVAELNADDMLKHERSGTGPVAIDPAEHVVELLDCAKPLLVHDTQALWAVEKGLAEEANIHARCYPCTAMVKESELAVNMPIEWAQAGPSLTGCRIAKHPPGSSLNSNETTKPLLGVGEEPIACMHSSLRSPTSKRKLSPLPRALLHL